MSYSRTIIQGNVGQAEFKVSNSGKQYLKFSVAVSRKFKDKQTDKYETDWFNCVCFLDSKVNYLSGIGFDKGHKVIVEGRMESNKSDGSTYWNLVADEIELIRESQNQNSAPKSTPPAQKNLRDIQSRGYAVDDDELPPF